MRKLKAHFVALCGIAIAGLLFAGNATPTDAQTAAVHPGYLHAIADLREARGILQGKFVKPAHIQAVSIALPDVEHAIYELKQAAKLDDKDLAGVPAHPNMPPEGAFAKVAQLLASARTQAMKPESDKAAITFRDQAVRHIDAANAALPQGGN